MQFSALFPSINFAAPVVRYQAAFVTAALPQVSRSMKYFGISSVQFFLVVVCVSAALVSGCSREREFNRPATFTVTGTALVDGGPVTEPTKRLIVYAIAPDAQVIDGEKDSAGEGFVGPDGKFEFSTFRTGDGLEPGTYKLTFKLRSINMLSREWIGDDLNGKYADPETSEFEVVVTGNETEPIVLDPINLSTD